MKLNYLSTCLFGLESELAFEIKQMGGEDVRSDNGKVYFSGGPELVARANIMISTGERVLIVLDEFDVKSFDNLFEGVKKINWEDYIGEKDAFPVKGYCLKSQLHSVPDCQSIIKKAVVDRLASVYKTTWFEETGNKYQIQFSIFKDKACIMLDTSGEGLFKRGYRRQAVVAPIRETLAAGIVRLARVKHFSTVYDPLCGSGTLLAEAGLKAMSIPPGIKRKFAAEQWDFLPEDTFKNERIEAYKGINTEVDFKGYGSDIDLDASRLTVENLREAGVISNFEIGVKDVKNFEAKSERGTVICNPPYGERLADLEEAREIYKTMGEAFKPDFGFQYYIISSDDEFENFFGRQADKKRKLYNGMIKCNLYMYFK